MEKVGPPTEEKETEEKIWFPKDEPLELEEPITREEILNWINKKIDSEVFVVRNCTSLYPEDFAQRLRLYQQYIRLHLK